MLKINKSVTPSPKQWELVVEGARNPMNSWDRSDSDFSCDPPVLGPNDLTLLTKLARAGRDHRKYLRMLPVLIDVTAPLYWWSEYDTYKVGTVANSCSKMHRLLHKPFEMNDFSFDKLPGYRREIKQFRPTVDESCELWKPYDEDYEVSDCGRIRRKGRVLSGSLHRDGYIFVTLHGKQQPLHRAIATIFCERTTGRNEVNHIDGNKQNNASYNLEWVTRSENQLHAVENFLQPRQVASYRGKFTAEQRDTIKREWDSGDFSRRELAKKYGVSHTCICDIVNDKYKHAENVNLFEEVCRPTVDMLNELRDSYFRCESESAKNTIWYAILQLLPNSYNQKRTLSLNYEVLANIYHSRKNHKLTEWHTLCEFIESLPYSELITGEVSQS